MLSLFASQKGSLKLAFHLCNNVIHNHATDLINRVVVAESSSDKPKAYQPRFEVLRIRDIYILY